MITRRKMILSSAAALLTGGISTLLGRKQLEAVNTVTTPQPTTIMPPIHGLSYTPATTLNGSTLPWKWDNGVKVFHLIAEPVKREFAPGMIVNCWGYNGQTPGPTIEAVEGDRVRILVTNKLAEHTTIHWHGVLLPNGMDGVGGLNQPQIKPGETYVYEFTLRQHGTQMYHRMRTRWCRWQWGWKVFSLYTQKNQNSPGSTGTSVSFFRNGLSNPAQVLRIQTS